MEQKPTNELDDILESASPNNIGDYLRDNQKYLVNSDRAFYHYMKDVLDAKGIRLKDMYSFAGLSESYGGKILRMEKKNYKDRDLIIRMCIAGHFNWEEINRALKLYGMSELYAKDPRDACMIVAINNRIYDFGRINEMLEGQGLKRLYRK